MTRRAIPFLAAVLALAPASRAQAQPAQNATSQDSTASNPQPQTPADQHQHKAGSTAFFAASLADVKAQTLAAPPSSVTAPPGQSTFPNGQPRHGNPAGNAMAPCASDPQQQCYSPEQLSRLAENIGKRFPELAEPAKDVLTNPTDPGNVRDDDVKRAFNFLASQGHSIAVITQGTGLSWQDVRANPKLVGEHWDKIAPEDQSKIRSGLDRVERARKAVASDDDNPFAKGLQQTDLFKPEVVKAMDIPEGGPDHGTGGVTPGEGGSSAPGAQQASDAADALRNGDPQAAAADAQQALQLDPQNEQALSTLAAANYDLKDMGAAAQAANKALALDPNDAQAQTVSRLAHSLVAGDAKMPSAPKLDHAYADVPAGLSGAGAPWHQLNLPSDKQRAAFSAARAAESALNRGDLAEAKAAADRAIANDPHSAYAYGLKAFAEIKGGDSAAALRDAVAGLALNPGDKMALKARAQALLQLGQYRDGLMAAEAAVSGDPTSAYAHYLLAEARQANGDRAGAQDALKAAAALDMRYADMYKASLQVAENGDMSFLFPDLKPGALAAAAAAGAAAPSRAARMAKIAGGAAAGGGLLAWLLWQLFGASLAPALKTVFTRKGPRVSEPAGLEPAASPAPALPGSHEPGLLRGQYKTARQIGMGGMGMVYEGTDVSLNRRVAIKKMRDELRLDRRQRERFVQEAKLVAALHHPNVVDIYAIVDDKDELALIFEYVAGKTLHELVHGRGPLPFADALRAYRGVASALEYAHARGIIHRDLKPSNIMLTEDSAPKVMDFGIARTAKDALTRYSMTNTIVGTPPYMAPEQEQGVVRKESDVYALAVCFYETVTGALPFAGTGGGMIMNKVNKAYTPASRVIAGLPPGLDEVFDKAFEPDPDKRYRSVAELQAALEALPVSAAA